MYYFAYGSNMSKARIQRRVPSATFVAVARLDGYRLCFHMRGTDASAKADAFHTGRDDNYVLGVIYEMSEAELPTLDSAESLGFGYESKWVDVTLETGEQVTALVYVALHIDRALKPFEWYKQHVVSGAVEAQLPQDYVSELLAIKSVDDPDKERNLLETSIHA